MQYGKHQGDEVRPRDAVLDIGAYEVDACVAPGVPGLVTGLRVAPDGTLTWDAGGDATSWDVSWGNVTLLQSGGLPASIPRCLEDDSPDSRASDPLFPPRGGAWYLVRGVNCAGNGSWDAGDPSQRASRDPSLASACP